MFALSFPALRYLVSQLFDVSGQSTIEQMAQKEEITIPWGTGIVGHVADKGVSVNIPDCYKVSPLMPMGQHWLSTGQIGPRNRARVAMNN